MTPTMLVCTPLRCEWLAARAAIVDAEVRRTGYGRQASVRAAASCSGMDFATLAIAGLAGGTNSSVASGDLIVASEVWDGEGRVVPCPGAGLVAAQLRAAGLPVRCGPITSVDGLVSGAGRAELAAKGALAADLESAPLAMAAAQRPLVVVRAVVDTPQHPLARVGTVGRALRALTRLRRAVALLPMWARAVGERRIVLCRSADEVQRSGAESVVAFSELDSMPANAHRVTRVEDIQLAWLARARTIAVVPSVSGEAEMARVERALRGLGPVTRGSCGGQSTAGPAESAPFARFGQDEAIRFAKEVH